MRARAGAYITYGIAKTCTREKRQMRYDKLLQLLSISDTTALLKDRETTLLLCSAFSRNLRIIDAIWYCPENCASYFAQNDISSLRDYRSICHACWQ